MSPNHQAFVTFTVHFKYQGKKIALPLDIVEVMCSHTRVKLTGAFCNVVEDFGVETKVGGGMLHLIWLKD